jgi:hypothetical protein
MNRRRQEDLLGPVYAFRTGSAGQACAWDLFFLSSHTSLPVFAVQKS